ncbi:putative mixed polyketide synthase/non-ribosomal peptide synthetase domain protein [Burkholderia pseudomallei MSHR4378]|nr:putative mixed polyketide synthase/non-ribosomal peptide synthetase domain protein [Burkholderia pseudomallei MSHR4378]KGS71632.1 hypothetical protein X990_2075 [Burkholderia pseudomallei MSHR4868]
MIDGAISPCRRLSATLMHPDSPATVSRWPMFGFTEPIAQNPVRAVWRRYASVSAATSTGSPSFVPVPCAST